MSRRSDLGAVGGDRGGRGRRPLRPPLGAPEHHAAAAIASDGTEVAVLRGDALWVLTREE